MKVQTEKERKLMNPKAASLEKIIKTDNPLTKITKEDTSLHQESKRGLSIPWRRQWHPTPVTLAWKIPWMEEPGRLQSSEELDTTERLHFHFSLSCTGEGNGNPLQCSCLENPRDDGAWRAAVYGVTQSQTWLKWLSSKTSKRLKEYYEKFYAQKSHNLGVSLVAQW